MAEPKRQLKIETTEDFYQWVQAEKLKRNLTLHDLVTRALRFYCAVPEKVHDDLDAKASQEDTSIESLLIDACYLILQEANSTVETRLPLAKHVVEHPRMEIERRLGIWPEAQMRGANVVKKMRQLSELFAILSDFPVQKLRLLHESLALDLKYYRSARLKEPMENRSGAEDRSNE